VRRGYISSIFFSRPLQTSNDVMKKHTRKQVEIKNCAGSTRIDRATATARCNAGLFTLDCWNLSAAAPTFRGPSREEFQVLSCVPPPTGRRKGKKGRRREEKILIPLCH
jgi:hypothetical protein